MKPSEYKARTQPHASRTEGPFFDPNRQTAFFSDGNVQQEPFFQPSRVWPRVQAKLTVGAVGDKYEQEADQVAANVVAQINDSSASATGEQATVQRMGEEEEDVQMSPMAKSIQRMGEEEEDVQMKPMAEKIQRMGMGEEEDVQMKPVAKKIQRMGMEEDEDLQMKPTLQRVGNQGGTVSTNLEAEIQSARGGGQALAPDLQAQMGQAMGADFSGVRVHTDAQSDRLNQSIQAKAFTTGQDVFFRQGAYEPGSRGGQELIAHELTHVVQQSSVPSAIQGKAQEGLATKPYISIASSLSIPTLQRSNRSKKLMGDLVKPKTGPGPEVTVQKKLVEALEKEIGPLEKTFLDSKKKNPYEVTYVGSIKLPVKEKWKDVEDLISKSQLINADSVIKTNIYPQVEAAEAKDLVIRNTLRTMEVAKQLEYLQKSKILNDDAWQIVVEIHYYRNRNTKQQKFHKDSAGDTLFVNLNFVSNQSVPGPEYVINPATSEKEQSLVEDHLPKVFVEDLNNAKEKVGNPKKIMDTVVPTNGFVAFVDEAIHHKSPTLEQRTVDGKKMALVLRHRLKNTYFIEAQAFYNKYSKYKENKKSLKGKFSKKPTSPTWMDKSEREKWLQFCQVCNTDSDKEYKRNELEEILPKEIMDTKEYLIEAGGQKPFKDGLMNEKMDFVELNERVWKVDPKKLGSKVNNIKVRKKDQPPLVRQISEKLEAGETLTPAPPNRTFFRTWVRAVKVEK